MKSLVRRLAGDERGVVAMLVGFAIVGFVGFAAIVVDVGYLVYARRVLQASTDAAALAGAQDINKGSGGTWSAAATSYSATSGNQNARANLTITMVSGYPQLRCFTSTGISCTGPDNANGIVVQQTATVPLFFGKVLGMDTATISASAAAGSAGGAAQPVDAMLVIDTTASMNEDGGVNCSGTKMDCAFEGFRLLLSGFTPSMDQVGLMIFPGLKSSTYSSSTNPARTAAQNAATEYDCNSNTPAYEHSSVTYAKSAISKYNESANPPTTTPPLYLVVPLSTDYKTSDAATTLNTSSNLVKAARGGATGCKQGLSGRGGVRTYYAHAVTAAQNYLQDNGRAGTQKLIIVLSDGDATVNYGTFTSQKQCRAGITAAQAATAAGMTVVTIAYNASTSSSSSCDYDRLNGQSISACEAMRQMASTSDRFYSTNTSGSYTCTSSANPLSDLNQIFQHIGTTIGTGARLLPDNTT